MKITKIRPLVVKIPREDSFGGGGTGTQEPAGQNQYMIQKGWRGLYSKQVETMLVKIETDEGLSGIGEGQAPIGPEVTATVVRQILSPLLTGRDPLAIEALRHEMYEFMNIRGHYGGYMVHAISGVDMALADLRGKALNLPVASLLGGPFRESLPAYVSGIRGASLDEKCAVARDFIQRGFTNLKAFLGFGLAEDLEHIEAFTNTLGAGARLMVDVLWNYDVASAIRLGRFLQDRNAVWLESPTAPEDVAGHAEVARALDLPVATGETETSRYQFLPWFQNRALDIAQPDVARCGITEAKKIADLAEAFHIPVALHTGISLGPGIAASLQVAAAIPNLLFQEYQPVMLDISNRFLKQPLKCASGYFELPKGPGLGIELNEEALAGHLTPPFTL